MLNQNQTDTVVPRVLQLVCSNTLEVDRCNSDERAILLLLKALHRAIEPEIEFTIVMFSRSDDRFELTRRSFSPETCPTKVDRLNVNDLRRIVEENNVVHVHQPCSETGTIAVVLANQSCRPIVATFTEEDKSDSLLIKWNALSLIDRTICFSEQSAERLRLLGQIGCVDVIHGPFDSDAFVESKLRRRKRNQIICVGPIRHDSGLDVVIKTLPTSLRLIVYGPVCEVDYLQHLKVLASGRSVDFISESHKELRELYEESLAAVVAYQYDGIRCRFEAVGRTLLESMSLGTPVICSRVGALPEYLPGGQACLAYDDPGELATILQRVAAGEWPEVTASPACVTHVKNSFSLAIVGHKLRSIYTDLSRQAC